MSMIRTLLGYVGEYKKDSILTPLFMIIEVTMEVLIPYVTASIIDDGIQAGNLNHVFAYGGLMVLLAMLSLAGGVLSARYGASASTGFAKTSARPCMRRCRRSPSRILTNSPPPASSRA